MKLKYYLRGLGIGIVVTALLMGFATKGNQEMSDEEIKARAAELGMVEQMTLADIRDNAEASQADETAGTPTEAPMLTEAPAATDVPAAATDTPSTATEAPAATVVPAITMEPENTPKVPETEPVATEKPESTEPSEDRDTSSDTDIPEEGEEQPLPPEAEVAGDVVQVTIHEGNNSVNVSRVLEEAGLIESATAFDRYLRSNGYSKIINTGKYEITLGTSEEQIAHIITNTD